MRPAPGWCLVRLVETAETYAGSAIVIPDTVRERVARNQVEIAALPAHDTLCYDADCDQSHPHPLPRELRVGDWALTAPRSLIALPDTQDLYLCAVGNVWGVLRDD